MLVGTCAAQPVSTTGAASRCSTPASTTDPLEPTLASLVSFDPELAPLSAPLLSLPDAAAPLCAPLAPLAPFELPELAPEVAGRPEASPLDPSDPDPPPA